MIKNKINFLVFISTFTKVAGTSMGWIDNSNRIF
jgi:hypothetical protein